jgi:hypothetical protein
MSNNNTQQIPPQGDKEKNEIGGLQFKKTTSFSLTPSSIKQELEETIPTKVFRPRQPNNIISAEMIFLQYGMNDTQKKSFIFVG